MAIKTPTSGPNDPLPEGIAGDSLWIALANAADYPPGKEPPSVLILTKDEEVNIEECLDTLTFSDDIVVLDSYSSDKTCELSKKYPNVRVIKRKFDTWSKHSNWALENIHFKHAWVYYSDADERIPEILRDEIVGAEATRVLSDGKRLLQRLIEGRWLQASGVVALLPANTVDDDVIEVYTDASRTEVALRWQPLRMQTERPVIDGVPRPNRSLADYIAPRGVKNDHIGLFAVTAGLGVEKKEKQFLDDLDDYHHRSRDRHGLVAVRTGIRYVRLQRHAQRQVRHDDQCGREVIREWC